MTINLIEYNVKEAKISEMSDIRDNVLKQYKIDGDIKPVEAARKEPAKVRIAIEKKRKELKADALEYGRKVDKEAKRVSEPVSEIESSYDIVIKEYKAELDRLAQLAQEKEDARIAAIQARIKQANEFAESALELNTSEDIGNLINEFIKFANEEFDFQEFSEDANNVIEEARGKLHRGYDVKVAHEAEQLELEKQRKKDEAERAKFEAEKAAFEKQQAEANAKLQAEREAVEAEKRADEEKRMQAEIERERKELEDLRERDRLKRIEAEKVEAARLEQLAKEESERKAKQESEDRVRNAAPQLFEAIEELLRCDLRSSLIGGYGYQIELAESAYIAAGGNVNNMENKQS